MQGPGIGSRNGEEVNPDGDAEASTPISLAMTLRMTERNPMAPERSCVYVVPQLLEVPFYADRIVAVAAPDLA